MHEQPQMKANCHILSPLPCPINLASCCPSRATPCRLQAVRDEQHKVAKALTRGVPSRGRGDTSYPLTETNSLSPGVAQEDVEVRGGGGGGGGGEHGVIVGDSADAQCPGSPHP